jgi:hypothetical protein
LINEHFKEATIGRAVFGKMRRRLTKSTRENHCSAIVEGMSKDKRRLNPPEPVATKGQRSQKWRCSNERHDRRTDIVQDARQRQWFAAEAASSDWRCFNDNNTLARHRQRNSSRKPIGASANHHGIIGGFHCLPFRSPLTPRRYAPSAISSIA